MTVSQDKDLAAYLKEARSFDYDSRLAAERSKRTAWIIAGAASVMALTSVAAVGFMAPLKEVVPFVIRVDQASGVPEPFSGFPSGTRAIQLPDGERKHPFLEAFGRPARALACECERESTTTMAQALQLVGGKLVHQKLVHEQGLVAQLAASSLSPSRIVEELFLVTLCRPPSSAEQALLSSQLKVDVERRKLVVEDILWNLLNHREFLFQH